MKKINESIKIKIHKNKKLESIWVEVNAGVAFVSCSPVYLYDRIADTWNCPSIPESVLTTQQMSNILTGYITRHVAPADLVDANIADIIDD